MITSINVIKVNFPTERKYPSIPISRFSVFYIFLSGVNAELKKFFYLMNFLFITCFLLIYSLFLAMIRSLIISDPYHPHLSSLFSREGKEAGNGVNDGPCLCDEAFVKFPRV